MISQGKLNRVALYVVAVTMLACGAGASAASAAGPWWQVNAGSRPAVLPANGEGTITVTIDNLGDAPAQGSPVVIKDKLPAGVTVEGVSFSAYLIAASAGGARSSMPSYPCRSVSRASFWVSAFSSWLCARRSIRPWPSS